MPAFRVGKPRVGLQNSTQTIIGTGATETLEWDTVAFEDPAIFDPLSPTEYPISKTGLWIINLVAYVYLDGDGIGQLIVYRDTTDFFWTRVGGDGPLVDAIASTWVGELQAGEILTVDAYYGGSTAMYIESSYYTQWSIARIGPDRWT